VQGLGIAYGLESMRRPDGGLDRPDARLGLPAAHDGDAHRRHGADHVDGASRSRRRAIGNGISLLIFAGIVVRLPSAVTASYTLMTTGELKLFVFVIILAAMVAVTAAVVLMQEGQRKIPVQYAKRVVGRRVYGGQSTHIPLRINTAGVIPVIFASSADPVPGDAHALRPASVDAGDRGTRSRRGGSRTRSSTWA